MWNATCSVVVLMPVNVGIVVEVAVVERVEHAAQFGLRQADIDQQLQMVELRRAEFRLHREGGAVQLLRRTEFLAVEAVGDHDVVADGEAEHSLGPIGDDVTQAARCENARHLLRHILEARRPVQ